MPSQSVFTRPAMSTPSWMPPPRPQYGGAASQQQHQQQQAYNRAPYGDARPGTQSHSSNATNAYGTPQFSGNKPSMQSNQGHSYAQSMNSNAQYSQQQNQQRPQVPPVGLVQPRLAMSPAAARAASIASRFAPPPTSSTSARGGGHFGRGASNRLPFRPAKGSATGGNMEPLGAGRLTAPSASPSTSAINEERAQVRSPPFANNNHSSGRDLATERAKGTVPDGVAYVHRFLTCHLYSLFCDIVDSRQSQFLSD